MKDVIQLFTASCFIFSLLSACQEDSDEGRAITLPSDLQVMLIEDTSELGLVNVMASAEKANFYTITFYDAGRAIQKEVKDGVSSHKFNSTGTYQINVKAHSTYEAYIEKNESVTLTFGLPGNNGNYPTKGYTSPMSYPNYTLVWNDEFDGNSLNTANWNYEIGTGNNGWGNNELQYYRQENTSVADGILTIEARQESFEGSVYTSSRLTTEGKQSFQYGRIDIRAAMPFGNGLWPALWMLGDNFQTAGWPFCGEIDIMEMVGGETPGGGDDVYHGTAHWADSNGQRNQFGGKDSLASGTLADEFHVYSITWDNQKITWFFDDQKYHELDITPAELSEFNQKFFFIFNVAVGGDWPGSPNSSTRFPQKMFVDYVRVFQ